MLRRTAAALRVGPRASRAPHVVLGVAPDVTEEKLKEHYRGLARKLHPDMPTGDAKKFQEVTAAYNIMKDAITKGKYGEPGEEDTGNADGSDPLERKMKEHMRKYREDRERGRPKTTEEMLWDDEVWDTIMIVGAWFAVGMLIIDHTLRKAKRAQHQDLSVTANAVRAATPAEYSDITSSTPSLGKSADLPDVSEDVKKNEQDMEELERERLLHLRRSSARAFKDLREFFLVFDTDVVTQRRFSQASIATERIDEERIYDQCYITKHINAASNVRAYENVTMPVTHNLEKTDFASVDAGPTVALTVEALKRMPKHNPSDHRLTFVEYQGEADHAPRCYVAIINDRFMPGTGKSQRAVVTGREEFHAALALRRLELMEAGDLKRADLVNPGWVPVMDRRA